MMRDDEGGRVSMVCERMAPSEAAFAALLRALAPLQSHAAGLRSVAYGASGSGGVREVTADERAIDAGAVTRGSVARRRIVATSGEARATLLWLVTYAHASDATLATMADLYAQHHAPAAEREAARRAPFDRSAADSALVAAKRVAQRAPTTETLADAEVARARAEAAAVTERRTVAAMRALGMAALAAALEAWDEADAARAA